MSKKPTTDQEIILDLRKKLKRAHQDLDTRNQATKCWIESETRTRAYCHKLENVLKAYQIDYLNDPAFTDHVSPLDSILKEMNPGERED